MEPFKVDQGIRSEKGNDLVIITRKFDTCSFQSGKRDRQTGSAIMV
jgi:hypothetical protein